MHLQPRLAVSNTVPNGPRSCHQVTSRAPEHRTKPSCLALAVTSAPPTGTCTKKEGTKTAAAHQRSCSPHTTWHLLI